METLLAFHGDPKVKGHEKAKSGQESVRLFLEEHDFLVAEVKTVTSNGIDILAIKNGIGLSFEVKTVIESNFGARVKKPKETTDFIAVVMPSGQIHLEQTSEWLKLTQKDGSRSIKRLVDLYKLLSEAPVKLPT